MLPGVQLFSSRNETSQEIYRCLTDHGYCVSLAESPATGPGGAAPPAICIVDLAFLAESADFDWDAFVSACREQQTACLVYSTTGEIAPETLDALKPAADLLSDPNDPDEVLFRVKALTTVRRLTQQLAIARHQARTQQQELQNALQSAAQIQRRLIPSSCPSFRNLTYAWHFMPSDKVGGDLFNIASLDETTVMTYLLDVSGHGISSAMVSMAVHQSLSPHTGQGLKRRIDRPPYYEILSPARVINTLEKEYPFERFEEFFTLIYLLLDAQDGTIRYCSAGHPAPILVRRDGRVERLTCGGTIIGLGGLVDFEEGNVQLNDGDRLFLFTDGITEHGLAQGEAFGEQRLIDCLRPSHPGGLEGNLRRTVEELFEFGRKQPPVDDVTLIGIAYEERAGTGD